MKVFKYIILFWVFSNFTASGDSDPSSKLTDWQIDELRFLEENNLNNLEQVNQDVHNLLFGDPIDALRSIKRMKSAGAFKTIILGLKNPSISVNAETINYMKSMPFKGIEDIDRKHLAYEVYRYIARDYNRYSRYRGEFNNTIEAIILLNKITQQNYRLNFSYSKDDLLAIKRSLDDLFK